MNPNYNMTSPKKCNTVKGTFPFILGIVQEELNCKPAQGFPLTIAHPPRFN